MTAEHTENRGQRPLERVVSSVQKYERYRLPGLIGHPDSAAIVNMPPRIVTDWYYLGISSSGHALYARKLTSSSKGASKGISNVQVKEANTEDGHSYQEISYDKTNTAHHVVIVNDIPAPGDSALNMVAQPVSRRTFSKLVAQRQRPYGVRIAEIIPPNPAIPNTRETVECVTRIDENMQESEPLAWYVRIDDPYTGTFNGLPQLPPASWTHCTYSFGDSFEAYSFVSSPLEDLSDLRP